MADAAEKPKTTRQPTAVLQTQRRRKGKKKKREPAPDAHAEPTAKRAKKSRKHAARELEPSLAEEGALAGSAAMNSKATAHDQEQGRSSEQHEDGDRERLPEGEQIPLLTSTSLLKPSKRKLKKRYSACGIHQPL